MKYLIISDIHGSCYYAQKIPGIVEKEKPDKIVLLGDLFYPSGRNILPGEYDTTKVAHILNQYKDKMIAVKGNCDSKEDELLCEFPLKLCDWIELDDLAIFLTHGHFYNRNHLPKHSVDIFIFGHIHTGLIEQEDRILFANPGSLSCPRNGSVNSYLTLDNEAILLKDSNGIVLKTKKIKESKN